MAKKIATIVLCIFTFILFSTILNHQNVIYATNNKQINYNDSIKTAQKVIKIDIPMVENLGIGAIVNIPIIVDEIGDITAFNLNFGYDREKLEFVGWDGSYSIFGEQFESVTQKSEATSVNQYGHAPVLGFVDIGAKMFKENEDYHFSTGPAMLGAIQFKILTGEQGYISLLDESAVGTIEGTEAVEMQIDAMPGGVQRKKYDIIFKDWDGTILNTQVVEHGNAALPPENPTREDYIFTGWDKELDYIVSDLVITAQYNKVVYTVLFENWDGTQLKAQIVEIRGDATAPAPPTRQGYTFIGWSENFTHVISNLIIIAQYTINKHIVNFDSKGGSFVPSQILDYHSLIIEPAAPTKIGNQFEGWFLEETLENIWDFATDKMPAQDITLYAKWTKSIYGVSYDGNGNTEGSPPIDENIYHYLSIANVKENSDLKKTGYKLNGWNTKSDGTGTDYVEGANLRILTQDILLYAKWIPEQYNVIYNGNGNTGGVAPIDSKIYLEGDIVTVAKNTNDLWKRGFSFIGWNTDKDGNGVFYSIEDIDNGEASFNMQTEYIILYAQWTANKYRVIYNDNGSTEGAVLEDANKYEYLESVSVLGNEGNLSKIGHRFGGWNRESNGSGKHYMEGEIFPMESEDVTLYAKWIINNYRINYHGNGNTSGYVAVDPDIYNYENLITVLENTGELAKTGYIFGGWNTASDGSGHIYLEGEQFYASDSDVDLYAYWITPTVIIRGIVRHPISSIENEGLADAIVRIRNKEGEILAEVNTDENGYFETYPIAMVIDEYDIQFYKAEYRSYYQEINIEKNTNEIQVEQKILQWGDVDGSGRVNSGDIANYWGYIIRGMTFRYEEVADLNGDEIINAFDVVRLWNKITKGIPIIRENTSP